MLSMFAGPRAALWSSSEHSRGAGRRSESTPFGVDQAPRSSAAKLRATPAALCQNSAS